MPSRDSICNRDIPVLSWIAPENTSQNREPAGNIWTNLDKSEHPIARSSAQDRRSGSTAQNLPRTQVRHPP